MKLNTPELDRMAAVQEQSQTIGEFLDWLQNERHVDLCAFDNRTRWLPIHDSTEELLAEYFSIDLKQVEQEKQGLLAALRSQ